MGMRAGAARGYGADHGLSGNRHGSSIPTAPMRGRPVGARRPLRRHAPIGKTKRELSAGRLAAHSGVGLPAPGRQAVLALRHVLAEAAGEEPLPVVSADPGRPRVRPVPDHAGDGDDATAEERSDDRRRDADGDELPHVSAGQPGRQARADAGPRGRGDPRPRVVPARGVPSRAAGAEGIPAAGRGRADASLPGATRGCGACPGRVRSRRAGPAPRPGPRRSRPHVPRAGPRRSRPDVSRTGAGRACPASGRVSQADPR